MMGTTYILKYIISGAASPPEMTPEACRGPPTNGDVTEKHVDFYCDSWWPSGKHTKSYGKPPFLVWTSTISMAIFNSYVKLPEGNMFVKTLSKKHLLMWIDSWFMRLFFVKLIEVDSGSWQIRTWQESLMAIKQLFEEVWIQPLIHGREMNNSIASCCTLVFFCLTWLCFFLYSFACVTLCCNFWVDRMIPSSCKTCLVRFRKIMPGFAFVKRRLKCMQMSLASWVLMC